MGERKRQISAGGDRDEKQRGKAEYYHKQPGAQPTAECSLDFKPLRAQFPWPLQKERNLLIESLKPQTCTLGTWTGPKPSRNEQPQCSQDPGHQEGSNF